MQLTNKQRFSAVAASLLGVANPAIAADDGAKKNAEWNHNFSAIYYVENDERVSDAAVQIVSNRTTEDEKSLTFKFGVDSLTGSSPSGQPLQDGSGGIRLFDIDDTRYSAALSYSQPLPYGLKGGVGLTYSSENDYTHTGINASVSKELNQKNTTFSLGVAQSADSIDAVSGTRTVGVSTTIAELIGEQDKDVSDVVLSWTQVWSKNTITQLNYSYSFSSGYLNDPYKVVSLVDPEGIPLHTVVEARPEERNGHSIYAALNTNTRFGIFKPSLRAYTDDWGIDSATLEFRFTKQLSKQREIEPYVRYYVQTAADFYRAQIPATERVPFYLSSDYRLSEFQAVTAGIIYRWKNDNDHDYSIGLDYYHQVPTTPDDQLAGQEDLNPGIQAAMLRFSVSF